MRERMKNADLTVIVPAKNESVTIGWLLEQIRYQLPQAHIIVVNDGSTDNTAAIALEKGVEVISHPYSKGNGAAIKSGVRAAKTKWIAMMDADGQHLAKDLEKLYLKAVEGYDLVVGARTGKGQASLARWLANTIYNKLSSWITGHTIEDLTSGMRVVDRQKFCSFLHMLPNGFSYPTTSTMAFFRAGYSVKYESIEVKKREGKSHIRLFKDGSRFFLIIFKVGMLYSPLKVFTPVSAAFFSLGIGYYMYTWINFSRFTNMSALLFICSVLVFLIGMVSEQITTIQYASTEEQAKKEAEHSKRYRVIEDEMEE